MNVISIILSVAILPVFAYGAEPVKSTTRDFPIHLSETAPGGSKEIVAGFEEKFQSVPYVIGVMAESPALLRSYTSVQQTLSEHGALSPAQNNIVQMAVSRENECFY